MFANTRNTASHGNNLIEFKAGRCKLEPGSGTNKRNVVAETEKGLVFIKQTSDQLMHFCWKNRESGALVDDLIVFPGDTEFKEVKGCPNGQVFMLKFKSSDERRLFWVQESSIDSNIVHKVNDLLNKPPPQRANAGRERHTTGGGLSTANESSFQEFGGAFSSLDQNQLMQLLNFMSPSNSNDTSVNTIPMPGRSPSNTSFSSQDVNPPRDESNTSGEGSSEKKDDADSQASDDAQQNVDNSSPSKNTGSKKEKPDDDMELD